MLNPLVEYINVIIKIQFWCVKKITENCAGGVWLKCSADSNLIQKKKIISITQSICFLPHSWYFTLVNDMIFGSPI